MTTDPAPKSLKDLILQSTHVSAADEEARDHWLASKVKCPKCRCTRMVKNCERYVETESWEMPWIKYEVCICQKCGHDMEEVC